MPSVQGDTQPQATQPLETNPAVVNASGQIGPIVGKGPITDNAGLNTAIGTAVVGASQAGMATLTGGPEVLGTSIFLNLVGQLVKKVKWFPEHEGLIVLFFVLAFLVSVFVLFHGDIARAFLNAANSTMQALVNYKGDKAAGLNIMPPVPEHLEFAR